MSDRICAGPAKTTSCLLRGEWGRCLRRPGGPWIDLALRSFRRVRSIKHEPAPMVHRRRVRELQLTAQPQLVDDVLVARAVLLLEVVEQATTLPDHDQQTATRVEILLVRLQMLGQILDPLRQQSHLHLWCAGVLAAIAMFLDQFLLALDRDRHRVFSLFPRGSVPAPEPTRRPRTWSRPRACPPPWRGPCRREQARKYGRGLVGGAIQPAVPTEGGSPRWPSKPGPGCRPARFRRAKGTQKRRDYAPGPSEIPAKSPFVP